MTPPVTTEALDAVATKALADELFTYANQLVRVETQAGLGGKDLSVRVNEPGWLADLMRRAAGALQARRLAAAEASLATATSELARLRAEGEAKDRRIAELTETWTDEAGTVWSPPTAWAYAKACAALHKHRAEVEALKGSASSYSTALAALKLGASCRRQAWKAGKSVRIMVPQAPALSYLALVYDDGRQAPWTPTRCDQLEDDWLITRPEQEVANV